MKPAVQKRLAISAALAAVLLFLGANAHLLTVALQSQPDCRETAGAMPCRRSEGLSACQTATPGGHEARPCRGWDNAGRRGVRADGARTATGAPCRSGPWSR